jgi:hypothetical protein
MPLLHISRRAADGAGLLETSAASSRGDKNLVGGRGNLAGQGPDNALGEAGNDLIIDGTLDEPSKDNVSGGSGKDVILVDNKPAMKDSLTCGPGFDRALADRKDVVAADCEKLVIVHGTLQDVIRQENRFFQGLR